VELAVLDAPLTVNNFVTLARKGYFNGLIIHRVRVRLRRSGRRPPRRWEKAGPGYTIRDD
jgi:cyclophilin family peptidyl-prolyl cis-trans isomerase